MEQMSTKDALTLLNNATAALVLNRNDHNSILIAIQTLQRLDGEYQSSLNQLSALNETVSSLNIKILALNEEIGGLNETKKAEE